MKFTTAILALAATAVAVPTNGGGGGGGGVCNTNSHPNQVCCSGGLLNILCFLQLGGSCTNDSYCCKSAPSSGGLINIGLECIKL
ncbi:hypothetical protein ED733_006848 [Metarhizium rileyi]|uniref:Hydrophobin n=1 Tax=Metarhizium rileyi (strain RCEF 4871) TaxID=1649241 RepID=A0A5C6GDG0_METRR|nr:hypothetical protein ED733_006848 [Metarhizium rileyi]